MRKLRVLSLFSGIGAFEKALSTLNINYELVNYCEKEKNIAKSFSILHNVSEEKNLGDITNVDEKNIPNFDLMTWGFPCVNFSKANRNKNENRNGLDNKDSGLYFEGMRILRHKKPKYSIIENVADLATDDKFKAHFELILSDLEREGYNSYVNIMNAKEYGFPQNRIRLFIVSIRKDVDDNSFTFPNTKELKVNAKDLLDDIVEDKFMKVNPNIIEKIKTRKLKSLDILPTITKAIGRGGSSGEYISNCAFIYKNTGVLRRMTPKETMLFMGFNKEDYFRLKQNGISDTVIFNMSGNSICVCVIEEIYNILLKDYKINKDIIN